MRWVWIALFAYRAAASAATAEEGRILVVADPNVSAYQEAVQGLKRGLGARPVVEATPAQLTGVLTSGPVRLAVAVGAEARAALVKAKAKVPVVSTMLLLADAGSEAEAPANSVGAVYLDLELAQVAREVARLFPNKRRVGVIVGPSRQNAPNRVALRQLEQDGFTVKLVESDGRAALPQAVRALKGKVDMLVCLPDDSLFDSRTIPLLLRAALEHELPVVGFSPAFVRAGAVVGVFPDYGDIGAQTAAVVARALNGSAEPGEETPRKVASVTNPTVMRLVGWKQ